MQYFFVIPFLKLDWVVPSVADPPPGTPPLALGKSPICDPQLKLP